MLVAELEDVWVQSDGGGKPEHELAVGVATVRGVRDDDAVVFAHVDKVTRRVGANPSDAVDGLIDSFG